MKDWLALNSGVVEVWWVSEGVDQRLPVFLLPSEVPLPNSRCQLQCPFMPRKEDTVPPHLFPIAL